MIAVLWAEPEAIPAERRLADGRAGEIVDYLGGTYPVARAFDHKHPTTVQAWRSRNSIPNWRIPQLIELGNRLGKPLTHADFFAPLGSPIGKVAA